MTETGTETTNETVRIAMTRTTGTMPEIGTEMETVEAATKIGRDMMAFAATNAAIMDAMKAIAIIISRATACVMSPDMATKVSSTRIGAMIGVTGGRQHTRHMRPDMVTKVPSTRNGAMIGVTGGGQHTRRMRPEMVTKLALTRTGVTGGGQHPRRM